MRLQHYRLWRGPVPPGVRDAEEDTLVEELGPRGVELAKMGCARFGLGVQWVSVDWVYPTLDAAVVLCLAGEAGLALGRRSSTTRSPTTRPSSLGSLSVTVVVRPFRGVDIVGDSLVLPIFLRGHVPRAPLGRGGFLVR